MKEIEVYIDTNGLPSTIVYDGTDRKYIDLKIKGDKVYSYLEGLSKDTITGIYKDDPQNRIITYQDKVVRFSNWDVLMQDERCTSLKNSIKDYYHQEQEERQNIVTRKNKHSGKIVIASSLVAVAMLSAGFAVVSKGKKEETKSLDTSYIADSISIDELEPSTTISFDTNTPIITEEANTTSVDTDITDNIFTTSITDVLIPTTEPLENQYENSEFVFVEYEDRSNLEKAIVARELYWEQIEKYATIYGLDPELVLAVAIQERGIHSTEKDPGGATGLMQIQNRVWVGKTLSAYNFETGEQDSFTITEKMLADCDTNIQLGCMILQNTMQENHYNILMGLQSYNTGTWGLRAKIREYANDTGQTVENILDNPSDCGWLPYRDSLKAGDSQYVEHVLSFMGPDIHTYVIKKDGTKVEMNITNKEKIKAY